MKTPLVSVAMVVSNVERFLPAAIESILDQTYRDFEFVILDFGSSDRSPEIVRSYQARDDRIKFHVSPHSNLSEARNDCCFRAQGTYFALLDADDVALPDRLERQVAYLESHPEIGILGGANDLIDEADKLLGTVAWPEDDGELRKTLQNSSPFCTSTVTFRAEVFRAAGGYRKALGDTHEDYDLYLRIMEHCRGVKLGEVYSRYRLHSGQIGARRLRALSLGRCVARASGSLRRQGKPDPVDSADSITPQLLIQLGITADEVECTLLSSYSTRVLNSLRLNNGGSALPLVDEMLETLAQSKHVPGSVAAETWFTAARAYYRGGDIRRACGAMTHAALTHPSLLAGIPWRGIRRVARRMI